jgi:CofD-related protein of GAK system
VVEARILFFSGGSALRETARRLKRHTTRSIHLVTPFDSGGSSARLRQAFAMPSVGDLRNRLMALGDEEHPGNPELFEIVNQRFPDEGDHGAALEALVSGNDPRLAALPEVKRETFLAALRAFDAARPPDFDLRRAKVGNLVITGGWLQTGRALEPVIERFSQLAHVLGVVRPIVEDDLHLAARLHDGTTLFGQDRITAGIDSPIADLWLVDTHGAPREARISDGIAERIASADLVVFPPGSFYTSVCANLLPAGVSEALARASARKIYVPNTLPDPEQLGMDPVTGGVARIERFTGPRAIDAVLCAKSTPTPAHVERIERPLLDEEGAIDPDRLVEALLELAESLDALLGPVEVERETVPAVAAAHGPLERAGAHAADDDGRVRLLDRTRLRVDPVERDEAALEARSLLRPERAHRLDILVGARALVFEGHAERVELLLQVADAEPEDEAPAREYVEAAELLREHERVALRQDHDAGAEADRLGRRGDVGQRSRRVQHGEVRRSGRRRRLRGRQHHVLTGPDRIEAGGLGGARRRHCGLRLRAGSRSDSEVAELHALSPLGARPRPRARACIASRRRPSSAAVSVKTAISSAALTHMYGIVPRK